VKVALHILGLLGVSVIAGATNAETSAVPPASNEVLPVPAAAEIKSTAIRFLQPTNAQRLEQLQAILRDRGLPFELQSVPNESRRPDSRAEGSNVLVTLGNAAGSSTLVIGAHFDAATLPDGKLSGGMVDNASSVAVLVHLATAVRDRPFKHRVQFAFFDLEEQGLVGSRHYVDSPRIEGAIAMINLDTLQGGDTLIYGPMESSANAPLRGYMRDVCATAEFFCLEFPSYPPSDDRSFGDSGIPNISLAVVPRAEAHQLWLLLNGGKQSGLERGFVPEVLRTIHTPADRPDRLDPVALTTAYRAAMALLLQADRQLP
jgi:Zn-dependent M28 family amino/carboxypeptidase